VASAIVYVVLSSISSISAYTTREAVKAASSEETSRPKIAAAREEKAQNFSELAENIHQQVNDFRRAHGLQPLRFEQIISAQAIQHSLEMVSRGSAVSHAGFEERLKKIGEQLPYRAGAENVAASIGYENPARTAVDGWKTSPGHRKNMLGDFTLTGIGIAQSEQGSYFITQIFLKASQ
jgi:uncharacterized protein YkwD